MFSSNFQTQPYWWDRTARPQWPAAALPKYIDVAIIGAGYTGLCAALQTARAGRTTAIFDAADAGWGCSSRNGGQISTGIKPSLTALSRKYGPDRAQRITAIGQEAMAWIGHFINAEKMDCDFKHCGRFYAAHSPRQFRLLTQAAEPDEHIVPQAEQWQEIGSDFYHGGIIQPHHAALDPARYHQELLQRVLAADAQVIPHCKAIAIKREGQYFRVKTEHGEIQARNVLVATNGYTDSLLPWLQRRAIPIGSYMIATDVLSPKLAAELIPKQRNLVDSRRLVVYYRLSPDGQRLLFGGRVSLQETDPRLSAPALHRAMTQIFPQLHDTQISHSWLGFIAYTFDALPHLGMHQGIHYAMGYCGSGIALSSYLGTRIGQQILELPEGATALDALVFPTRPLYQGKPWFLAPSIRYYRWLDRLGV